MANNFSQSYYGLPFAFPPPPQQPLPQTAQPDAHLRRPEDHLPSYPPPFPFPADPHSALSTAQPPFPNAFPQIPGLQSPMPPSTNFVAFNQTTQHPSFPPQAFQIPDPSPWMALLQNGNFPPPLPGISFPPPPLPQAPQGLAGSLGAPSQSALPTIAPNERVTELMDTDHEDGELSEGEVVSHSPIERVNGRTRFEPPRSVPQPGRTLPQATEQYNPDRPAAGQDFSQRSSRPQPPSAALGQVDPLQQEREAAKQFVKLLHSNNIGYHALAKENLDQELLRGLYKSLNLPSEPAPILPPQTNGATATQASTEPKIASSPQSSALLAAPPTVKPAPVKTNLKPVAPSQVAPSPVDRKDYIARLQAAKKGNQLSTNAVSPSVSASTTTIPTAPTVSTASTAPGQSKIPTQTPSSTNAKQPVTDAQRARNTELIKQRLEAMRTKTLGQSNSSTSTATISGPVGRSLQGRHSDVNDLSNGTPSSMIPGIPGLFTSTVPPPSQSKLVQLSSLPPRPPLPTNLNPRTTIRGLNSTPVQPSTPSLQARHDDSATTQANGDDSDGSAMDIDDESVPSNLNAPPPAVNGNIKPSNVSMDNVPRQSSVPMTPSALSTPGSLTPALQAREQEMLRKKDQLEAMKALLKRKLAEKREKDKLAREAAEAAEREASTLGPTSLQPPQSSSLVRPSHPNSTVSGPETVRNESTGSPNERLEIGETLALPQQTSEEHRKKELQDRLSVFNFKTQSLEQRLAELHKEEALLRSRMEETAKEKLKMTAELNALNISITGNASVAVHEAETDDTHGQQPSSATVGSATDKRDQVDALSAPSAPSDSPTRPLPQISNPGSVPTNPILEASNDAHGVNAIPGLGQSTHILPGLPTLVQSAARSDVSSLPGEGLHLHRSQQASSETLTDQRAPLLTSLAHNMATKSTPLSRTSGTPLDEEDFYSPTPVVGSASMGFEKNVSKGDADESPASSSEEGEIEMSESSGDMEEGEYRPDEASVTGATSTKSPHAKSLGSLATSTSSTEEEDDYEPPDVDAGLHDKAVNDASHCSEGTPTDLETTEDEMDIESDSSESTDDSESEGSPNSEALAEQSIQKPEQRNADLSVDLAPNPSLQIVPVQDSVKVVPAPEIDIEPAKFAPYVSPLRAFKSYRYHPSFLDEVSGGFSSLTFSHQIDANKVLCETELRAGSCEVPGCLHQHFRDIGITGEALLVELGTANPGETQEQKQQWNDGLRGVLRELRQKSIKDPRGIAVEIAKFRRKFMNDDTRVVNLMVYPTKSS